MPFSSPKWPICHEQNFVGTNHYYYFHLPTGPFHCAKFYKNPYSESRVMRMCHFWAPNGSFAPNKFYFWKILISFSSTYWPLSFCKILKKFLKPIQIYEDVPLSGPKYPNLSWTKLFGTNHYYYSYLPIGPFHWAKLKKENYSRSRVMRMHHFWAQNGHLPILFIYFFFWKIINIALIYLLVPFIVKNF